VTVVILNLRLKVMVCGITMSAINAEIKPHRLKFGIKIYLKAKYMLIKLKQQSICCIFVKNK